MRCGMTQRTTAGHVARATLEAIAFQVRDVFEAMRDALLAVAGSLDEKLGGPAVELAQQPFVTRRTIYGFVDRQNLPRAIGFAAGARSRGWPT